MSGLLQPANVYPVEGTKGSDVQLVYRSREFATQEGKTESESGVAITRVGLEDFDFLQIREAIIVEVFFFFAGPGVTNCTWVGLVALGLIQGQYRWWRRVTLGVIADLGL